MIRTHLVISAAGWLADNWWLAKTWLKDGFGIHEDGLHVIVGVVLQVFVALVLRRPLGSVLPWLAVLAVQAINEWIDISVGYWPERPDRVAEAIFDTVLTMLVPTVLLLFDRWRSRSSDSAS